MARRIDLPPYVVAAGYGKRFFAYLIDLIVIVLGIIAFYFLVSRNFILPAVGFYDRLSEKDAFMTATHITKPQESSWGKLEYEAKTKEGEYGYENYANRIWYYCTTFLPSQSGAQMNPENFAFPSGIEYLTFLGNKTDAANVGKWTWANFFEPTGLYEPVKNAKGEPDYSKMPILTSWYQQYRDSVANQMIQKFHDPLTNTGAYDDAYAHLMAQNAVAKFDQGIQRAQWLSYIPAVVASPVIFNFIVPLLFPKGKTFGKLFLGTAISTSDGFVPTKGKLAIRYGIITICYSMLIVQNYWVAIFGTQLLMTLIFVSVALSGTMQGVHDIFSDTVVVDERKSKIFRSEEGRARYIENHPDSDVAEWFREKTSDEFMEEYGDRMEDD